MSGQTEFELKEMGTRLRDAREGAGMSRAALSKATAIPAKAIEKFEYGSQEPSVTRLRKICETLGVPQSDIVPGEDEPPFDIEPESKPRKPEVTPKAVVQTTVDVTPREKARDMLNALDEMRFDGFDGSIRSALALVEDIAFELRRLEPEDLMELAQDRKLHRGSCSSVLDLENLFGKDVIAGQAYCGNVEQRIIDTAVFGVDLYMIELSPLTKLAEELSDQYPTIETPGLFGGWGNHEKVVPMLRPVLRERAFSGLLGPLKDALEYPVR